MAADLIIYAIVAAVLVFWLRSVLGTRNGEERQRDNPFTSDRENKRSTPESPADRGVESQGTIIDLPSYRVEKGPEDLSVRVTKTTLRSRVRVEPVAEAGLRRIGQNLSGFTLDKFMEGAEGAFELIVTSFARGDTATLRGLLRPAVFNDFEAAIRERATRGETVETRVEAVRAMDVVAAQQTGQRATITVRFTAQEVCLIRNAAGAIIAGEIDKPSTMIDLWAFERDTQTNTPIWYLAETRDEQAEPHKTPLPESRM